MFSEVFGIATIKNATLKLQTLVYATGGRERLTPAVCVDIVSSVVTPRETLAGTDYQDKEIS